MCPICNIRMARLDNLNAHTKKSHGMTWREAEKMTESTISGIPVSEHHKLPGTWDVKLYIVYHLLFFIKSLEIK